MISSEIGIRRNTLLHQRKKHNTIRSFVSNISYFVNNIIRHADVIEIMNMDFIDLKQLVDFIDLMKICPEVASSLLASSGYINSVKISLNSTYNICKRAVSKLAKQLASSLWIKNLDNQLASSLLTTSNRLVIIKPEQTM